MNTAPWIIGALVAHDYIDNPMIGARLGGRLAARSRLIAGRPPFDRGCSISLTAARRDGKIAAFQVEGISKACVQVR
jgi:hypothetical protein